jgi:hypothetical protein
MMNSLDMSLTKPHPESSMSWTSALKVGLAAFIVSAAVLTSATAAGEDVNEYDGQWHYGLTLYGWLPALTTDLNFPLPNGATASPSVTVKPKNYLSDLKFGAMAGGSARNGNWGLFTDIIYADIASLNSKVRTLHTPGGDVDPQIDINVNVGVKELIWTLGAGYTVARSDQGTLDILAGARYGNLKSSLGVNAFGPGGILGTSASTTQNINVWTGFVGVGGALRLGDDGKWFVPYEFDIGAGSATHSSSVTSFNGILALGYKFGWGDVIVGWRYLDYRMGSNDPIQKLIMSGPAIGARFSWQ